MGCEEMQQMAWNGTKENLHEYEGGFLPPRARPVQMGHGGPVCFRPSFPGSTNLHYLHYIKLKNPSIFFLLFVPFRDTILGETRGDRKPKRPGLVGSLIF